MILKVGEKCNVRQTGAKPMYRLVKTVALTERENREGRIETWLLWSWEAEQPTPDGTFDCGYAGQVLSRGLDLPEVMS